MKSKQERVKHFQNLKENIPTVVLNSFNDNQSELILFRDTYVERDVNKVPLSISWILDNTANTMTQLSNEDKPLIFIFGSAHKPGGGVLSGSRAQEEDISLHSSFYFQVQANPFYKMEHKDYSYSDYGVYVKEGVVLTDIYHKPLEEYKSVSFVSIASPNLSAFNNSDISFNEEVLYKQYETRLRSLFSFAEYNGHKSFIVGPWGCGVFGLSPERTALIFKKIISEGWYSGNIIFSILDTTMFETYKTIIEN